MKKVKIFHAPWCGPCRAITPMIEQIKEEYSKIEFIFIDIDTNPEEAIKYSIASVPTILFLNDGKIMDVHRGALTKTAMKTKLDNL